MNAAEDIVGIIYGIHCERIHLKKVFETLPQEVRQKYESTVKEVDEYMYQHGHCIAEIVLDLM